MGDDSTEDGSGVQGKTTISGSDNSIRLKRPSQYELSVSYPAAVAGKTKTLFTLRGTGNPA